MWDKRCKIHRIIDADTLAVILDQGFGDTKKIDLRLDGVFAPERKQVGAVETTLFVVRWVEFRNQGGWPFVMTTAMIRSQEHERTTFGRFVGTLTWNKESLNDAINQFVADNNFPRGTGS